MMPARGKLRQAGEPPDPGPADGLSVSDSESEELLKSTLSTREEGAMMEGRMIPSPSSPTVDNTIAYTRVRAPLMSANLLTCILDIKYINIHVYVITDYEELCLCSNYACTEQSIFSPTRD
jgi:hypothetical protein